MPNSLHTILKNMHPELYNILVGSLVPMGAHGMSNGGGGAESTIAETALDQKRTVKTAAYYHGTVGTAAGTLRDAPIADPTAFSARRHKVDLTALELLDNVWKEEQPAFIWLTGRTGNLER